MVEQGIKVTHRGGVPLEDLNIEFETTSGRRYRLTAYYARNAKIEWVEGYREESCEPPCSNALPNALPGGAPLRFYSTRTPDELTAESLDRIRERRAE